MFASGSAFCTVLRLLGPIACLVVSTGTQAAAQDAKVASSVLVRVGDPAPDATSPEALLGDLLPKLPEVVLATETGHIAFYAPRVMRRQNGTVVGLPAAQRREGLFVVLAGERTVRPVMLLRDQVPDDPAVHFHALLHGVRLGASGHVVFAAEVANTVPKRGAALGVRSVGVWLWNRDSGLRTLLRGGDPAPGHPGYEFVFIDVSGFGIDRAGNVLASLVARYRNGRDWRDLWRHSASGWRVIDHGQRVVPGEVLSGPQFPAMNSSGTVAALLEEHLLRASPDTQGNLPPLDERSFTGRLGEIAKNSRIRVSATGLVAAGSDRFGAFGEDDGGCYLVLPEGTAVPEAGADAEISGSVGVTAGCVGSTVCPIGDGRVAVLATWGVPGPLPGKGGIWVAARSARTLVALEGQAAPGTSHVFGTLGTESDDVDPGARAVFANGQGDVVFSARLVATSVNDPVHAFRNRLGVWLWRNGHLVLLAREGVPFEIEPGATRVLTAARPVRPSPWTNDGAVMLQVEWLPTDKDALAARSHLGKGPCRAVVAVTVTGLPAGRAAPAPVDKPKPVADATAGKPSGPDSAPASTDISDWFGSRRSEDGLWSPPAKVPHADAVAVVMGRLEAAQRTKWSASRITRERDQLLFSVLQYWGELFSSGKRIEEKLANLRQQLDRAKKAEDESRLASLQAEIVKAEADQRRLIPTSSRRFATLRGGRESQDWLNQAAVLPLFFSSGDSNEPGGSARLFNMMAAFLFATDLRNLHRMDVACSRRSGETRDLAVQTLQQLATELVDNKEATTELQQQSDWLLAKVNDLKRLLRAPGELDTAKAQVIADEILRWYLAADPAPELRK